MHNSSLTIKTKEKYCTKCYEIKAQIKSRELLAERVHNGAIILDTILVHDCQKPREATVSSQNSRL